MRGGINMNKKRNKQNNKIEDKSLVIVNSEQKVINHVIENKSFGLIDFNNEPHIIFTNMSIKEEYLKQKIIKIKEVLLEELSVKSLSDESNNKAKSVLLDLENMIENNNINKKELYTYTYEGFKLTFPELAKYLGLKWNTNLKKMTMHLWFLGASY